jgi:hypothetical protein
LYMKNGLSQDQGTKSGREDLDPGHTLSPDPGHRLSPILVLD